MIRALVIALVLLPSLAGAQEVVPNLQGDSEVPAESPALSKLEGPRLKISLAEPGPEWLAQTAPAQAQTQAPARDRRRRRPSMVGYINDAGVQSQVRFRFDSGTGVDAPDRAEFFYAKCGCYRDLAGNVLFDPDAAGPGPGAVTDLDFQQFYVQAEFAFHDRVSVFGELPARWVQPKSFLDGTVPPGAAPFSDQSGLSDIRAGVKLALLATEQQFLTLQLQGSFPTGDGRKGLGVEHASFEPALLYSQGFGDRTNIEGQFGFVYAFDGSDGLPPGDDGFAGNVLYYGIGPSVAVYLSNSFTFAPVVELVGWRVLGGFQTLDFREADGENIVNLKIGARFEFQDRNSLYVGYGHHLTDAVWYESLFRVEYRYTF